MNCARHRDATHLIDTYLSVPGSFPSLTAFASRKVEHVLNTKAEAQLILVPLTFGLAHVITRFIDTPSVKFAAWFYRKALGDPMSKKARA